MNWIVSIYAALLFFLLSPNVLLKFPPKGKPLVVAGVHAVVFAIVFHLTQKIVWELSYSVGGGHEGFREGADNNCRAGNPGGKCPSGFYCDSKRGACVANPKIPIGGPCDPGSTCKTDCAEGAYFSNNNNTGWKCARKSDVNMKDGTTCVLDGITMDCEKVKEELDRRISQQQNSSKPTMNPINKRNNGQSCLIDSHCRSGKCVKVGWASKVCK